MNYNIPNDSDDPNDPEFIRLLLIIKEKRGLDFVQYRSACLKRRINSRLMINKIDSYQDYIRFILQHPSEMDALLNNLTINLTGFFRDKSAWRVLEHEIIPIIVERKKKQNRRRINVWSAGVSSGEEAYTLAIIFQSALEHQDQTFLLKIIGTDIDDDSLKKAKLGMYSPNKITGIPVKHLHERFTRIQNDYAVVPTVRQVVQFQKHDLIASTPLERQDLIVCRNVLIYFNRDLQATILDKFYEALRPGGFLMLGKTETLLASVVHRFGVVNARERIYQRPTLP